METSDLAALATLRKVLLAVRPGIQGMLDIARRAYIEALADLDGSQRAFAIGCFDRRIPGPGMILTMQKENAGLRLRCIYTASRGFHVQMWSRGEKKARLARLPAHFIQPVWGRASVAATTRGLIRFNGTAPTRPSRPLSCSLEEPSRSTQARRQRDLPLQHGVRGGEREGRKRVGL